MTFSRLSAGLLCAAVLAGCGNEAGTNPLVLTSKAVLSTFRPGQPTAVDARQVLTPEIIAASDVSALLVVQLEADQAFTVIPEAANLGTVQWVNGDNRGLLRRDGIVVGTRGLGFDLYTADVRALDAAFDAGGAADALRVNRYLTGEGKIAVQELICAVRLVGRETLDIYGKRKSTRVFEEDCRTGGGDFVNRYWVEGDGTVRKSIEFISPEVGALEITRLTE